MMLRCAVVALVVLVSGCAGKEAAGTNSGPTGETQAEASGDLGALAGSVVNEEQMPVVGATVTVGGDKVATTDAGGRFALRDLAPGASTLFVERLGYESAARKVEVRAGETIEVAVVLKAIALDEEGFHVSLNRVFLLHLDNIYLSDCFANCGAYLNNSVVNGLRCDPCQAVVHLPPGPGAGVTEAEWPASGNNAINGNMCYYYYQGWSEASAGQFVNHNCLTNRQAQAWPAEDVKKLKTTTAIKMLVHGATTGVSYEHKISSWTSFAYGMDFPDDFSALPPG